MFKNLFKKQRDYNPDMIPEILVETGNVNEKEAFNRLKDNVLYFLDNGKNKVLQIESSVAGEGKSTVVANLAVMLAKNGKKVAVMDLDFRKPKIHKIFKTANTFGIVEYILGECSFEELVKKTEYGVDVFNRGKAASNASVIFMGEKFKALLEKLKRDYDVVLFDCPPVLQVSDYIHLAKLSSGVLFVVSCEKARRSQVKEAVSALKKAGANVMGTAITFSGKGGLGKNYGAYKNYTKYYGDYEGE